MRFVWRTPQTTLFCQLTKHWPISKPDNARCPSFPKVYLQTIYSSLLLVCVCSTGRISLTWGPGWTQESCCWSALCLFSFWITDSSRFWGIWCPCLDQFLLLSFPFFCYETPLIFPISRFFVDWHYLKCFRWSGHMCGDRNSVSHLCKHIPFEAQDARSSILRNTWLLVELSFFHSMGSI